MFSILLIAAAVALACSKIFLQGVVGRRCVRTPQDAAFFNGVFFFFVAVFIGILFRPSIPSPGLLAVAAVYGVSNALLQIFYVQALAAGPVSLTTLIVNFNTFPAMFLGAFLLHETVRWLQLLGIALLVLSMLLSVKSSGGRDAGQKVSPRWLGLTAVTFLTCAFSSSILKVFKLLPCSSEEGASVGLLFWGFAVSALAAFAIYLIRRGGKDGRATFFGKSDFPWVMGGGAAMGLVIAVYQRLHLYCITNIDSTLYFPASSGLQMTFMSLLGILAFHDKLTRRQLAGLVLGVIVVVLVNLPVGPVALNG